MTTPLSASCDKATLGGGLLRPLPRGSLILTFKPQVEEHLKNSVNEALAAVVSEGSAAALLKHLLTRVRGNQSAAGHPLPGHLAVPALFCMRQQQLIHS